MAKSLSIDLRSRVVEAIEGGLSRRQAAERFRVIPNPDDHDRCAHWRRPRDMIFQGWSISVFQA